MKTAQKAPTNRIRNTQQRNKKEPEQFNRIAPGNPVLNWVITKTVNFEHGLWFESRFERIVARSAVSFGCYCSIKKCIYLKQPLCYPGRANHRALEQKGDIARFCHRMFAVHCIRIPKLYHYKG